MAAVTCRHSDISESVFGKFGIDGLEISMLGLLGSGGELLLLHFVESVRFLLSLGLKFSNNVLLLPTEVRGEITEHAESSVLLHSNGLKSFWNNESLSLVIWVWNSLEDLQSLETSLSS